MKKLLLTTVTSLLLLFNAAGQSAQFTMVAVNDSLLEIYFRADDNVGPVATGISNVTFVLQLPQTYPDPQGDWTIVPNATYLGAPLTITATSTANGAMYNTLFSWTSNPNIAGTSFAANTEYLLASVTTPTGVEAEDVILTDWGNNRINNETTGAPIWATSIAVDGLDITNNTAIFYANPSSFTPFNSGTTTLQSTLSINVPLGIDAIDLTGTIERGVAHLAWRVINESEVDNYTVEYSINATQWEQAGTVKALNAAFWQDYKFDHTIPPKLNKIHYRIRVNEMSGKHVYSDVLTLKTTVTTAEISIYPTALSAGERIHISIPDGGNEQKTIVLADGQGRIVYTLPETDQSEIDINTSGLSSGVYYLSIHMNGERKTSSISIL